MMSCFKPDFFDYIFWIFINLCLCRGVEPVQGSSREGPTGASAPVTLSMDPPPVAPRLNKDSTVIKIVISCQHEMWKQYAWLNILVKPLVRCTTENGSLGWSIVKKLPEEQSEVKTITTNNISLVQGKTSSQELLLSNFMQ